MPDAGPVAEVTADGLALRRELRSESVSLPAVKMTARVELISSGLAVDARQLERAVTDGVDGVVLAASGIGNTIPEIGDAVVDAIDAGIPVVVATRCFGGAVAGRYRWPGGSRTLREHGTIYPPGTRRTPRGDR